MKGLSTWDRQHQECLEDDTMEDAIIVIEKAVNTLKPKTMNSCWRKPRQEAVRVRRLCLTPQGLQQPIKETDHEETADVGGRGEGGRDEGFHFKTQELRDTTPEKLEDNLVVVSASDPHQVTRRR